MPLETELYDILGISYTATNEDIKKAFRKKALETHPDKGGDTEIFKKINAAYEILSDPEKKIIYDNHGKNGLQSSGQIPDDILSSMFGQLFHNINGFGGIFQNMFNNIIHKTPAIIYEYKTTLEDICTRKIIKLKLSRQRICPCEENCSECNGHGTKNNLITHTPGIIQQTRTICYTCQGNGKKYTCNKCEKGLLLENKTFELHLTPDIENGHNYIFPNEGNQNLKCSPGDFIVKIIYIPHPLFQINGKNLIYTKNLSLKESLCGHTFTIIHPSGEEITLTTKDITTIHMSRTIPKGICKNSSLEIKYNIIFPSSLSDDQKEILYKTLP